MKKTMQVLGLILLTTGIVFAAANSDAKNNETCYKEWAAFCPPDGASKAQPVAQHSVDSHESHK